MRKTASILLFSALVTAVLSGCSGYNKILKASDYNTKYSLAKNYFMEGRYTNCSSILEECVASNPFMPDAPQRIAMDTSQKLAIRFGETLKKYEERGLDKSNLVLIPLVLAGYARYLKGVDDAGNAFAPSPDPLLAELQQTVASLEVREGEQDFGCLKALYSRTDVFGVDVYALGLGGQIEGMVKELYAGPGAVRKTLHKYVSAR